MAIAEQDHVEGAVRAVREAGGRATVALRCVVAALAQSERHCSAEELVAAVHAQFPEVNESTVYRTLERLEELGVAYHVHLGHGPAQWHLVATAFPSAPHVQQVRRCRRGRARAVRARHAPAGGELRLPSGHGALRCERYLRGMRAERLGS